MKQSIPETYARLRPAISSLQVAENRGCLFAIMTGNLLAKILIDDSFLLEYRTPTFRRLS